LLLALGCGEGAAPTAPRPDVAGGPGRILYLTYCASCHGPEGRGDGRVAPALRNVPPDLTRLFERYGTPLDRAAIADYVDGRLLLGAHGRREMPVWGREFFADAPPSTPGLEHTREHLVNVLVDYLQSIQGEQSL
jgi:mono/diheme cytochrome c family protein